MLFRIGPSHHLSRPLDYRAKEATTILPRGALQGVIEVLESRPAIPLSLEDGTWSVTRSVAAADTLRYRFVTDDAWARIDPEAPLVILKNDEAWSVRPVR